MKLGLFLLAACVLVAQGKQGQTIATGTTVLDVAIAPSSACRTVESKAPGADVNDFLRLPDGNTVGDLEIRARLSKDLVRVEFCNRGTKTAPKGASVRWRVFRVEL